MYLKQSTSVVISFGPFVDATDGVTLETGLVSALDHATTGIKLSKNGGALTVRSAAVTASTYDSYGNYLVTLSTTDTNTLGRLRMQFVEPATCRAVHLDFMVVPANVWDSLFGADALQVHAVEISNGLITAAAIAAGAIDADALAADAGTELAAALLDLTDGVETSLTVRGALRLALATLAGKVTGGATTTITYRNVGDTKNRVTETVDASGNRSAVVTDAT